MYTAHAHQLAPTDMPLQVLVSAQGGEPVTISIEQSATPFPYRPQQRPPVHILPQTQLPFTTHPPTTNDTTVIARPPLTPRNPFLARPLLLPPPSIPAPNLHTLPDDILRQILRHIIVGTHISDVTPVPKTPLQTLHALSQTCKTIHTTIAVFLFHQRRTIPLPPTQSPAAVHSTCTLCLNATQPPIRASPLGRINALAHLQIAHIHSRVTSLSIHPAHTCRHIVLWLLSTLVRSAAPSVRHLSLPDIQNPPFGFTNRHFTILLTQLPNLQSLSVYTPSPSLIDFLAYAPLPLLHSLTLHGVKNNLRPKLYKVLLHARSLSRLHTLQVTFASIAPPHPDKRCNTITMTVITTPTTTPTPTQSPPENKHTLFLNTTATLLTRDAITVLTISLEPPSPNHQNSSMHPPCPICSPHPPLPSPTPTADSTPSTTAFHGRATILSLDTSYAIRSVRLPLPHNYRLYVRRGDVVISLAPPLPPHFPYPHHATLNVRRYYDDIVAIGLDDLCHTNGVHATSLQRDTLSDNNDSNQRIMLTPRLRVLSLEPYSQDDVFPHVDSTSSSSTKSTDESSGEYNTDYSTIEKHIRKLVSTSRHTLHTLIASSDDNSAASWSASTVARLAATVGHTADVGQRLRVVVISAELLTGLGSSSGGIEGFVRAVSGVKVVHLHGVGVACDWLQVPCDVEGVLDERKGMHRGCVLHPAVMLEVQVAKLVETARTCCDDLGERVGRRQQQKMKKWTKHCDEVLLLLPRLVRSVRLFCSNLQELGVHGSSGFDTGELKNEKGGATTMTLLRSGEGKEYEKYVHTLLMAVSGTFRELLQLKVAIAGVRVETVMRKVGEWENVLKAAVK